MREILESGVIFPAVTPLMRKIYSFLAEDASKTPRYGLKTITSCRVMLASFWYDVDMDEKLIEECLDLCRSHGVTARGLEIAEEIMRSPPARRVESRSMSPNYTTRFPSKKMGVVIQAESRTIELANVYMKEFDKGVIGYWDQPAHKADLVYLSGKRRIRVQATMDSFVVSKDFIGLEECKPVKELEKLCRKSPNRYRYNSDTGHYEITPLERYLSGTGLGYRVITDRDINKQYVENLAFLYDFAEGPAPDKHSPVIDALKEILQAVGSISIGEVEKKHPAIKRESIFKAIWDEEIVADLEGVSFDDANFMPIASTPDKLPRTAKEYNQISLEVLPCGSPADIEEALRRYRIITPLLTKEKSISAVSDVEHVSARTLNRWKNAYVNGGGIDGLLPANREKGNRNAKLPMHVENLINTFIENNYLRASNKKINHIYQLFKGKCQREGIAPPSKKTFYDRVYAFSDTKSRKAREGAKSAYETTAYIGLCDLPEDGWPFTEATRFLERCHIDHTLMDIELIGDDGVLLGKPWLTIVVDEYSSFVLAYYLSFDAPSVISVMCAIRLMVLNHGVFPEAFVVDGGKEFESIYFEELTAAYVCAIISRKGKPRGGGAVERLFGSIDTMVTHNLTGNTTLTKNVRKLSASHNPRSLAVWRASELQLAWREIVDYFNSSFPIKDTKSPNVLRQESLQKIGYRSRRHVKYSDTFYMRILPSPKRPTARLRRNNTIQVNRILYWHSSFKAVRIDGETVPLRYDPFNLNHVYIFYKNEWIKCRAVRPQHRRASELDGAFLAEIRRRLLYLNEKAKESARVEMAELVERLDQEQSMSPQYQQSTAEDDAEFVDLSAEEEREPSCNEDAFDLWDIDIPDSSRSDG